MGNSLLSERTDYFFLFLENEIVVFFGIPRISGFLVRNDVLDPCCIRQVSVVWGCSHDPSRKKIEDHRPFVNFGLPDVESSFEIPSAKARNVSDLIKEGKGCCIALQDLEHLVKVLEGKETITKKWELSHEGGKITSIVNKENNQGVSLSMLSFYREFAGIRIVA